MRRIKIPYGEAESQFGHLYLPDHDAGCVDPAPMVVLVHGGYWSTDFSLVVYTGLARELAERGAVVWNVEYRRREEAGGGWPGTGRDVVKAIEALDGPVFENLATAGTVCNRAEASVVGHSAGGQLAVYAVAQLKARTELFNITTVVPQSAVLDFTKTGAYARPSVVSLMGAPFSQVPERYMEASPNEQAAFPAHVAAIHTVDDQSIPVEMSRRYVECVTDCGQSASLYEVAEGGHEAFVDPRSEATRQTLRILGI